MNKQNKKNVIGSLLLLPLLASFTYGNTQIVQPINSITSSIEINTTSDYTKYLQTIANYSSATTLSEDIFKTVDTNIKTKVKFKIARRLNEIENLMNIIRDKISILLVSNNVKVDRKILLKSYNKLNRKLTKLRGLAQKRNIEKLNNALDNAIKDGLIVNSDFPINVRKFSVAIAKKLKIADKNNTKPIDYIVPEQTYSHIPTGANLTDAMAYRFLNMSTFGATPQLVTELKSKGVVKWLDDQLNMEYNYDKQSVLKRHMRLGLKVTPEEYINASANMSDEDTNLLINDYLKAGNNINFYHKDKKKGRGLVWHTSSLFEGQIDDEQQVRQRVGYALSQIVVLSQSNDGFFKLRGEALSHYYDLLLKHAFGNYGDILYDVSMTPAMAAYLTYEANKKEHTSSTGIKIGPDENYGRELMQLFSIGLYKMNMDGSLLLDTNNQPEASYKQEDVNVMASVFTGLHSHGVEFGKGIGLAGKKKALRADSINPLLCNETWHDIMPKTLLEHELSVSKNCSQDVRSAINVLESNANMAPFISKKLILRLTKSNPEANYIKRVAKVFKNTNGNLKEVVRTILLDTEIWKDLTDGDSTKIKEPYLKFTAMLRAFDAKPAPQWRFKIDRSAKVLVQHPSYLVGQLRHSLGQFPTFSSTVFNFYKDNYVPTMEEFQGDPNDASDDLVAPEISIQTMSNVVNFSNYLETTILNLDETLLIEQKGTIDEYFKNKNNYGAPKLTINLKELYEIAKNVEGDYDNTREITQQMTDWLSIRLLGEKLPEDVREIVINNFSDFGIDMNSRFTVNEQLSSKLIKPLVRVIVDSASYSVN